MINNTKAEYSGELSINPFDLNLNINLGDYKLLKILNINLILSELIKTELLFNDNISINTSVTTTSNLKNHTFRKINFFFNIINGKINVNKTKFIINKIGSIELGNSNIFFENSKLTLNTDIVVDINNTDKLFSLLQTNKKFRKPIKNILINLDYVFLTNQIKINNLNIDGKDGGNELSGISEVFIGNNLNNWNKNKRLLNRLIESYEG